MRRIGRSIALLSAIAAAATLDPDPCPRCQQPRAKGLCSAEKCRAEVLPVMRPARLAKDTWSGWFVEPVQIEPVQIVAESNATAHADRMAAQSAPRFSRFGRSYRGGFIRNRRRQAR